MSKITVSFKQAQMLMTNTDLSDILMVDGTSDIYKLKPAPKGKKFYLCCDDKETAFPTIKFRKKDNKTVDIIDGVLLMIGDTNQLEPVELPFEIEIGTSVKEAEMVARLVSDKFSK